MRIDFLRKYCFLCVLLCPILLSASTLECRFGAFFPSGEKFRDLYGDIEADFQLEASVPICVCFEGWTNLDWFSENKKKKGCCQSKVEIVNVSFGIKYVYSTCENWDFYLGIGPSFGRVGLKNKTCCENEKPSKFMVGGVLKSGSRFYFCQNAFLDLFVDYLFQPARFSHHVEVGGVKAGLGLGIRY